MCGKAEGTDLDYRFFMRSCPLAQDVLACAIFKFNVTGTPGKARRQYAPVAPRRTNQRFCGIVMLSKEQALPGRLVLPLSLSDSGSVEPGIMTAERRSFPWRLGRA